MPENKTSDLFAECFAGTTECAQVARKLYRRYTLDDETLETHVRLEIESFDFRSKGALLAAGAPHPCCTWRGVCVDCCGAEIRRSNGATRGQQKIFGEDADNGRHNIRTSPSAPSRHEARLVTTNRPLLVNYLHESSHALNILTVSQNNKV